MEKLDKIIKDISAIMSVELPENTLSQLSSIQKDIESLQTDFDTQETQYIELKQKYIDNLKRIPVSKEEIDPVGNQPLSFEDCINAEIKKRK